MTFDIRQVILEQNDVRRNELITEGTHVQDSEGRNGKIVSADKTHAVIRWEDGGTDKVAFFELEQKKDYWFWRI